MMEAIIGALIVLLGIANAVGASVMFLGMRQATDTFAAVDAVCRAAAAQSQDKEA